MRKVKNQKLALRNRSKLIKQWIMQRALIMMKMINKALNQLHQLSQKLKVQMGLQIQLRSEMIKNKREINKARKMKKRRLRKRMKNKMKLKINLIIGRLWAQWALSLSVGISQQWCMRYSKSNSNIVKELKSRMKRIESKRDCKCKH